MKTTFVVLVLKPEHCKIECFVLKSLSGESIHEFKKFHKKLSEDVGRGESKWMLKRPAAVEEMRA